MMEIKIPATITLDLGEVKAKIASLTESNIHSTDAMTAFYALIGRYKELSLEYANVECLSDELFIEYISLKAMFETDRNIVIMTPDMSRSRSIAVRIRRYIADNLNPVVTALFPRATIISNYTPDTIAFDNHCRIFCVCDVHRLRGQTISFMGIDVKIRNTEMQQDIFEYAVPAMHSTSGQLMYFGL